MFYSAARLSAAILLALTGYVLSEFILADLPEWTSMPQFAQVNAGLGAIIGWRLLGTLAQERHFGTIGTGLTAAIILGLSILFVQAGRDMLERASSGWYNDPMEAILAMVSMALEHSKLMADPFAIASLVIGSVLSAAIAGFLARNWD